MVHHAKEGQGEYGTNRSEQIVGAVLRRSTNPCDVDAWRVCHDLTKMLEHDARDVIYGSTEAEIESEIWKRHPVESSGVALVTKDGSGWEVERTPRLMHADLNLLHEACAIHKRVLVGNDLVQDMGGQERLASLGFLAEPRHSRWAMLVRFNPRQVAVNRWKRQVEGLSQYFRPEFPPELMRELFDAVRPEHWHEEHPYKGFLATECEVINDEYRNDGSWGSRRSRRCRPRHVNLPTAPRTVFAFVEIARKLGKGTDRRPWRRTLGWKELLERLVEYVHGVEANGNADWRKLAKWVRAEARAAKVRIPHRKRLSPRPTFGQRAARRRRGTEQTHERTTARTLQAVP